LFSHIEIHTLTPPFFLSRFLDFQLRRKMITEKKLIPICFEINPSISLRQNLPISFLGIFSEKKLVIFSISTVVICSPF